MWDRYLRVVWRREDLGLNHYERKRKEELVLKLQKRFRVKAWDPEFKGYKREWDEVIRSIGGALQYGPEYPPRTAR